MKKSIFALLLLASTQSFAAPINVTVGITTFNAAAKTNTPVSVRGSHDIEITNNMDTPQKFTYVYKLCVVDDDQPCYRKINTITIAAHAKWNNHHDSSITTSFRFKGFYPLRGETIVQGFASKNSYSTVSVYS